MLDLKKMLQQNPQIKQLMNKGVDPKQMVIELARQGKVDVNQLTNMASKFGYKIPDEILQDIKNSQLKGPARF